MTAYKIRKEAADEIFDAGGWRAGRYFWLVSHPANQQDAGTQDPRP